MSICGFTTYLYLLTYSGGDPSGDPVAIQTPSGDPKRRKRKSLLILCGKGFKTPASNFERFCWVQTPKTVKTIGNNT
jgi:hypothetical protein